MSDLLGISGNAAAAYQLALATVSNNIANVSTDGYSRQAVDLREATPRQLGGAYIGTGVIYDRIKRQFDTFAELNLRNSTSQLTSQEPMVDYTNRVVDLLGSEDAGLVGALDEFFSSARGLTTDPASSALRGQFFRSAQGLASRFALVSTQLDLVDTETRDAVEGQVSSINTLAQQIAAVNGQLSKQGSADRQPSELMDQRDRLLRELSQYVGIRVSYAANGMVSVGVGTSTSRDLIVDGQKAVRLGTVADVKMSPRIGLVLDPYGEPRSLASVSSGRLAGLLSFREQVLDSSRNMLDEVARKLMDEVNALHRSGVDGYGQIGGDLFAVKAGSTSLAAGLGLAIDDPLRIAAAAQFRVIEDSNNTGRADATVTFGKPVYPLPADLRAVLSNNAHPAAGRSLALGGDPPLASVGAVAAGLKDVAIYLNDAQGDQQLQLLTRDGRHLLGSSLSLEQQQAVLASGGLEEGAGYSAAYLGKSGTDGYRGIQVFYGARADAGLQQAFDASGAPIVTESLNGLLQGARLSAGQVTIAADTVTLNGVSMPALTATSGTLSAADLANWFNTAVQANTDGRLSGVSASAVNEVRVPATQLRLDLSVRLNGVAVVPGAAGFGTVQGLVNAINAKSADSQVQASLSPEGELVLRNTAGQEGRDITVGALLADGSNALNVAPATFVGRLELQRSPLAGVARSIELGVGSQGKASVLADLGFRRDALPALLQGGRVRATATTVPAGALVLNGVALPQLQASSGSLGARDIAAWINQAAAANANGRLDGLQARAVNDVTVPLAQLKLDRSVVINGRTISAGAGFGSAQALVNAINAQTANTQVRALLTEDGQLQLTQTPGNEGKDIVIGSVLGSLGNALNLADDTYRGRVEIERSVGDEFDTAIEFGFGAGGKPSLLADLGFRTAAYLRGTVPDDVLVAVSDSTATRAASVSASYGGAPQDLVTSLRAHPMEVRFTQVAGTNRMAYRITDVGTGTVLAERVLDRADLQKGISYRGLNISFTDLPRVGDRFLLDGNPDGSGNNDNIRALALLQSRELFKGGKTLADAYTDQVNDMGNLARQASIAQDALTVVRDQAQENRDKAVGVNLDEEAANLIRFQQAYQASAKVMQVASQLFDAILQVR